MLCDMGCGVLEAHTPPLFLARTCSIVLSLCRGVELENDRISSRTPFDRLLALILASNTHDVFWDPIFRHDVVDCALWVVTKVRRAKVWADRRSFGVSLRALDAPDMQLHAEDILSAVFGSEGRRKKAL
jgi:hypothetical protein